MHRAAAPPADSERDSILAPAVATLTAFAYTTSRQRENAISLDRSAVARSQSGSTRI